MVGARVGISDCDCILSAVSNANPCSDGLKNIVICPTPTTHSTGHTVSLCVADVFDQHSSDDVPCKVDEAALAVGVLHVAVHDSCLL